MNVSKLQESRLRSKIKGRKSEHLGGMKWLDALKENGRHHDLRGGITQFPVSFGSL
jgi:hypothetical protein